MGLPVESSNKLIQIVCANRSNGSGIAAVGDFENLKFSLALKFHSSTTVKVCSSPHRGNTKLAVVVFISSSVCISSVLSNLMVLLLQFEYHICLCQCRQTVGYQFLKKREQCE